MSTATTARMSATGSTTRLWQGALGTAVLAGLAPRVNAVLYDHVPIWHLDPEARVLLPIVMALPLVLAGTVGRWAWHGDSVRLSRTALVLALLAVVGVLAFFLSGPIVFGGIAATLAAEHLRRTGQAGRRSAVVALVVGLVGCAAGVAIWLIGV